MMPSFAFIITLARSEIELTPAQAMELAKQLPLQETPLCRTSLFYPAIGAVSLPGQAVAGRVALVLPGLQLSRAGDGESFWKAGVSSFLFQLVFAQGRKSGPGGPQDSCGR